MTHGTEQHLEHAEHAQHAAHDPFDKRVAMTMAIVAAGLACVSTVSHRGHNETLRLQSEASIKRVEAANGWSYYQAKNNASRDLQNQLKQAMFLASETGADATKKAAMKSWQKQVDKYEGDGYWAEQLASGFVGDKTSDGKKIKGGLLADLQAKAKDKDHEGDQLQEESHHVHAQVNWLDFGNLGLELALVLCSVAVLSKQRSFWYAGITVGILGAVVAGYGVYGLYLAPALH